MSCVPIMAYAMHISCYCTVRVYDVVQFSENMWKRICAVFFMCLYMYCRWKSSYLEEGLRSSYLEGGLRSSYLEGRIEIQLSRGGIEIQLSRGGIVIQLSRRGIEIQLSRGEDWDPIYRFHSSLFVIPVLKQDLDFQNPYVVLFFLCWMSLSERWLFVFLMIVELLTIII